jgi:membrane-bound serine protease (ClpP class)
MAIIQLSVALLLSLVMIFLVAKYLPKSNIFKKFILSEEERSIAGYTSRKDAKELLGTKGVALTTLRPAGTVEINGKRIDVVTDSEFIENGKQIEVVEVEGMRIVVREIKISESESEKG